MGSDYFAVLRQPRRPWLDPDELKRKYQELTFARHPDKTPDADQGPEFSEITEAYRVLSNPRLRLQHLFNLEGAPSETSQVPAEIAELLVREGQKVSHLARHRPSLEHIYHRHIALAA